MAVVLPNAKLTLARRAHPLARDAHGTPYAGPATVVDTSGPWQANVKLHPTGTPAPFTADNTNYAIRLDPAAWPVNPGDTLTDGARTWIVGQATFYQVPDHPDVDYIAITAGLDPAPVL